MKQYQPISENKFYKIETYYQKGGFNHYSNTNEKRGYYLSVTPVERENKGGYFIESFYLFSGIKYLLFEVSRQSKAAEQKAEQLANEHIQKLIDHVNKQIRQ
jgi:hypothetical protein